MPAAARASSVTMMMSPDDVIRRLLGLEYDADRRRVLEECLDLTDREVLLSCLKAESERYLNDKPFLALRLAESLVEAAELVNQPDRLALGLLARGDALRFLGRYLEALPLFDEGARIFLSLGDQVGWARSRIGWVWSMHRLGRADEALPVATRALEILVCHQEWMRGGNLVMHLAWVCSDLARYDQALAYYERAEKLYENLGPISEIQIAWVKQHRAWLLNRRGEFRAALTLHRGAREIFVRHGQSVSILQQDQYIAYAQAGQGHYTLALRLCGDVLAAHERAGHDAEAAWVALDMVECYLGLNRYEEALALAEETVARFERCGAPTESAKARLLCAVAQARLGAIEPAQAILEEVTTTFTRAGLTRQLGIATLLRAGLYLADENWPAALAAASCAHAVFAERGVAVQRAQAELVQARALLGLGRLDEASSVARSALAIADERELLWLAHEGHHVLGSASLIAGDAEGALAEYGRAISSIERVQSRLATELRTSFLEDKLQVYHDAIDCCLHLGKPDLALEYLERAKSRALVDYLASNLDVRHHVRDDGSRQIADELARLREEHAWLYNRLYGYGLARLPQDEPSDAERERLQAEVRAREKRIARLLERLALRDAAGWDEILAVPSGYHPTPPLLDEGTVLLEFYFREDGGAVFVRSRSRLEVVSLAVRPSEIRRLLSRWQLNLEATARAAAVGAPLNALGDNARAVLNLLYQALIGPVADRLAGNERAVVVPFGPTHWVPFHALHDGRRYLLEYLEVSACLSSSLLRLCSRQRPRDHTALVVGHSDGGRLHHVLEEARAVAALLPGECYLEAEATRAAVIQAAPRHGVVHLAAHGEARLDNPTFAHLKLADGQLSMVDVFNLELDGALITLSACETGRSVVRGGDELVGLSRGFLFAGASALVQSLWRVDDSSTARLMEHFYQALSDGRARGAALREAQRASLGEGNVHPYFWAPFQLTGNHGEL